MSIDLMPGFGAFTQVTSVTYEAESEALFSRFTTDPGTTRKDAINACIASLKTAGVWSKLSNLYVLAAHEEDSAKLNWITNARNLTEQDAGGGSTFTVDQGFNSNGGGEKWVMPTNDGSIYTLDSAHISVWCRTNVTDDQRVLWEFPTVNVIFPYVAGGEVRVGLHDTGDTGSFGTPGTSQGFTLGNRSSSTARQVYRDGSLVGSQTNSSTGSPAASYWIGNNSSQSIAVVSAGGSLTSGEVSDFYDALNTLKTAIGW